MTYLQFNITCLSIDELILKVADLCLKWYIRMYSSHVCSSSVLDSHIIMIYDTLGTTIFITITIIHFLFMLLH